MSRNSVQETTKNPDRTGELDFLIDRICSAPLDDPGRQFVRASLSARALLEHGDEETLLKAALIACQHGLIDDAIRVYERLHEKFPGSSASWREHCQLLGFLGMGTELIRLRARAATHLGKQTVDAWDSRPSSLLPEEEDRQSVQGDIAAPFIDLRREEEQIKLYMNLFRGRQDAFARQWVNRAEEKQGYVPVRRPMQASDVRDHLAGHRTYGIYLLDHESKVRTGVIDMDLVSRLRGADKQRKHKRAIRREALYLHKMIAGRARDLNLSCLAEVSGGKGYHFWFPVDKPVPARQMRRVLHSILSGLNTDVQCFNMEIFPKQDKRTGKGFGNLVKLPLGIHRGTGKPSFFVLAGGRGQSSQFELLRQLRPTPADRFSQIFSNTASATLLPHPRQAARAKQFPELVQLEQACPILGQLIASLQSVRELSIREEKVLLGTIGHLPRARPLLHHLFEKLPEYSRPLLDYKISRIRGTVLGCKRIHSLMEQGGALPCHFEGKGYPHPLRHLDGCEDEPEPKSERVENLRDAVENLKMAIRQVERYM